MDPAHLDPPLPDPPPPDTQADPDPPVETATEGQLQDVGRTVFGLRYGDESEQSMATSTATPRRGCYTWTTWLTPLLASEASCWYAPWVKSHYKIEKIERGDFDLAKWKAEHGDMVTARAERLRADGWSVLVEDQNFFTLKGRVGTLSGKPDIVAIRGDDVLVVDCKGGARKAEHIQQVLIYLFALPRASDRYKGKRIAGEVEYRDGSIPIPAEQFTEDLRLRIVQAMVTVSGPEQPAPVPSARECGFCDVSKADCPARIETAPAAANVSDW